MRQSLCKALNLYATPVGSNASFMWSVANAPSECEHPDCEQTVLYQWGVASFALYLASVIFAHQQTY